MPMQVIAIGPFATQAKVQTFMTAEVSFNPKSCSHPGDNAAAQKQNHANALDQADLAFAELH